MGGVDGRVRVAARKEPPAVLDVLVTKPKGGERLGDARMSKIKQEPRNPLGAFRRTRARAGAAGPSADSHPRRLPLAPLMSSHSEASPPPSAVLAQVDGAYGVRFRNSSGKDHPTADELTPADEELWAYYLEWSHAARMVLNDRRLLRRLGLLRSAGASGGDDGPGEPPIGP